MVARSGRLPLLAGLLFCAVSNIDAACDGGSASLSSVIQDRSKKFIFVGGKGGVGKTTSSSALAIQIAMARSSGVEESAKTPNIMNRLINFYKKYNQPKTEGFLQDLLGRYKDRGPAALWGDLEAKYGPEDDGAVLLISTDPAHSLSDAFRTDFSGGVPHRVKGVPGLRVMEIDPSKVLGKEIKVWKTLAKAAGIDMLKNVGQFQQWLTSVPGIDEATALASVVDFIDGGKYSAVVFDTAPTGHTLKLLALPDVLQIGLDKLESFQSKIWDFVMLGSLFGDPKKKGKMSPRDAKKKVTELLKTYKEGIVKVGKMLKDKASTTFVPVTIAEHLSVSESRRLLSELHREGIHTSHIIVNQLIPARSVVTDEKILSEIKHASLLSSAQLIGARRSIQQKYLKELRASEEVGENGCLDIVQLPLLPSEVTGPKALTDFSTFLSLPFKMDATHDDDASSARPEL